MLDDLEEPRDPREVDAAPEPPTRYEAVLPWLVGLTVVAVLVALALRPDLDERFAKGAIDSMPGVQRVSGTSITVAEDATASQIQAIIDAADTKYVSSKNFSVQGKHPGSRTAAQWLVATRGLPLTGSLGEDLRLRLAEDLTPERIVELLHSIPDLRSVPGEVELKQGRTTTLRVKRSLEALDALVEVTFRHGTEFDELIVDASLWRSANSGVSVAGGEQAEVEGVLREVLALDAVDWQESTISSSADRGKSETWTLSGGGYVDGALAAAKNAPDAVVLAADLSSATIEWDPARDQRNLIADLPASVTQIELVKPGPKPNWVHVKRNDLERGLQIPEVAFALEGTRTYVMADDWISLSVPKTADTHTVVKALMQLDKPMTVSDGPVAARFVPGKQPVWLSEVKQGVIADAVEAWVQR